MSEKQQLTWKAASYLARASATEAVGGNMNQRWTATQRFQSNSEHTFTTESDDCHTCRDGQETPSASNIMETHLNRNWC